MTSPVPAGLLAEVTRRVGERELVESRHLGHLVVVGPDGRDGAAGVGDQTSQTFVRSTAKPFQTVGCLELLAKHGPVDPSELDEAEIAVSWASHRGEQQHIAAVLRLLARSGTDPDELTCPTAYPEADQQWPPASADEPPSRVRFNCSGKHAMFALVGQGLGLERSELLDPSGPLQRHLLGVLDDAIGPLDGYGIDGCGAPAVVAPLDRLAEGYRQLALGGRWSAARDAAFAHPGLIGGAGRLESALLEHGVVAKVGAEGVYAAGWLDADGDAYGVAVKAEDGAVRGGAVAMLSVLEARGAVPAGIWSPEPVLGGAAIVGVIRPAGSLARL